MATARPAPRGKTADVTNWILTSLAVSLLFHVVLVHYVGGIRLFDVESFTSTISRWFNVVDVPRTEPPPEIARYAATLPPQAEPAPEPDPTLIPIVPPVPRVDRLPLGDEGPSVSAPPQPSQVRLPDSNLPIVSRVGLPDVDQTLTQVGEVAPVQLARHDRALPPGPGVRPVAAGAPALPAPPPPSLAPPAVEAPRPEPAARAGEIAPPALRPNTVPVFLGDGPPPGIEIPIGQELPAGPEPPTARIAVAPGQERPSPTPEPKDTTPLRPLSGEVAVNLAMYEEPGDPLQYFRLEIALAKPDKLPVIPKDVMFICDVSMSIRLADLRIVRHAIVSHLRELGPADRFNVVVFSTQARKLYPDFVEPTPDRIAAAEAFMDRIPGQIRTNVYGVLQAVVHDIAQRSDPGRPTNIFFISDGYSTSGIRDARRIVNEIGALARPNFSIFTFDAGRGSNRYLLDLVAYRSRGTAAFTEGSEDPAHVAAKLFQTVAQPVLMELRPVFTNLQVEETYPDFLPNLYADHPIVIYGRCRAGENVTIELQGRNPLARHALAYSHVPGPPDPALSDIAREWARRKIHRIVSDMAREGETPALRAEIERLGAKYHVRTPYGE